MKQARARAEVCPQAMRCQKAGKARARISNREFVVAQVGAGAPEAIAAHAVNERAQSEPEDQRARIRQAGKGREEDRNLRRIKRQIADASGGRDALRREFGLRLHVVQIGAAVSESERAESVEMQKVRALEIAGAIKQAGRGHVPQVDGPEAEREDEAVGAQAFGS